MEEEEKMAGEGSRHSARPSPGAHCKQVVSPNVVTANSSSGTAGRLVTFAYVWTFQNDPSLDQLQEGQLAKQELLC